AEARRQEPLRPDPHRRRDAPGLKPRGRRQLLSHHSAARTERATMCEVTTAHQRKNEFWKPNISVLATRGAGERATFVRRTERLGVAAGLAGCATTSGA